MFNDRDLPMNNIKKTCRSFANSVKKIGNKADSQQLVPEVSFSHVCSLMPPQYVKSDPLAYALKHMNKLFDDGDSSFNENTLVMDPFFSPRLGITEEKYYFDDNVVAWTTQALMDRNFADMERIIAVSYTHLTLPTIYSV